MLMLKPKMLNLVFEDEIVATIRDGGVLNYDGIYLSPARAGGNVGEGYSLVEAPESAPPLETFRRAIQSMLDHAAQTRRYDNGTTISTYTNSTNAAWAAEAEAFVVWRDAVWAYAYTELAKVEAELRPVPTVEGFLAELPVIIWPEE